MDSLNNPRPQKKTKQFSASSSARAGGLGAPARWEEVIEQHYKDVPEPDQILQGFFGLQRIFRSGPDFSRIGPGRNGPDLILDRIGPERISSSRHKNQLILV